MAKQFYHPTTTLIELGPEGAHVHYGEIVEMSSNARYISRSIVDDTIAIEPSTEAIANDLSQEQTSNVATREGPSSY